MELELCFGFHYWYLVRAYFVYSISGAPKRIESGPVQYHHVHRSLPHTSSIFPSVPSPRRCAAITRYKRHHIPPLPPLPSSSPSCRFFYQTDAASGSDMMRLIRGEGCLIGMPNGDWKVRCDPLSFTWFQCVMGSMGAAVDSSTESLRPFRSLRRGKTSCWSFNGIRAYSETEGKDAKYESWILALIWIKRLQSNSSSKRIG